LSLERTVLVGMFARFAAARLRALAAGAEDALREWLECGTAPRLERARRAADSALARLEGLHARCIALGAPQFPPALLDLRDPPALLFVRGAHIAQGGTAVVGTRTPSEAGAAMAYALAQRVAAPIVAGLALGIDAAAHRGALERGVATIAYVGHGLGATYPPEHRALEDAIAASSGAVISERPPGEPVTRWALVRRDRLQAAHADACILVETERYGGAMHTLRFAASLGRPRFALEPRAGDPRTNGNAKAIADGAGALGWDAPELP